MATVIGLDIGGTKIAAARVTDGVAENIITDVILLDYLE